MSRPGSGGVGKSGGNSHLQPHVSQVMLIRVPDGDSEQEGKVLT